MEANTIVVEKTSSNLPSIEAEELRSDVSHLLRQKHTRYKNHSNLNAIQCRALTILKQDTSRVVLTADKGWPWSSWTNRITTTRLMLYYKTPTHTKCSARISLTASKQINNNTKGH